MDSLDVAALYWLPIGSREYTSMKKPSLHPLFTSRGE